MSLVIPAGHSCGSASRSVKPVPQSALEKAFAEYQKSGWVKLEEYYREACWHLSTIATTVEEVHGLFLSLPDQQADSVAQEGIFLSAAYAHVPERVIVHDLDHRNLHVAGYKLPEDKLLINSGTVGEFCFMQAQGVAVNIGTTNGLLGYESDGLVINAGQTEWPVSGIGKKGRMITLCDVNNHNKCENVLTPERLPSKAREYIEELVELCHGPIEKIHDRYGEVPALTIRKDVSRLLGTPFLKRIFGGYV